MQTLTGRSRKERQPMDESELKESAELLQILAELENRLQDSQQNLKHHWDFRGHPSSPGKPLSSDGGKSKSSNVGDHPKSQTEEADGSPSRPPANRLSGAGIVSVVFRDV
ncbi:uncharacterized protein FTJAE_6442 [Fusarium tjaetaba]|uniref:Uncharacterized protein n=1 Tax=Fusarium tjaetaba TaxID=1567544 RepID=A0A8H5RLF9_9HYPO|nr:uncharacterized protein FTJAE_6442 [Fusarium tjaetaba]KAF5635279.1 hypothetical protein FTJAE_6442 [Fusarium tjaetaba]